VEGLRWRLNIGNYLFELDLAVETVLTPAEQAKKLDGRGLQKQKEAESFATLDSSSSESDGDTELCSSKRERGRSGPNVTAKLG
jgi:hypothetical protein